MSFDPRPGKMFLPAPLQRFLPYFVLTLAIFAVYGNIYDNGFVFDDDLLIHLNTYLSSWKHIGDIFTGSTTAGVHIAGGFYRPLQILLYLVISRLTHASLFWYHFLNVALHAANACLLVRLGSKLGLRPGALFLATLIWAMHPLHTEAVTYMSATADPLFAFFCLLGLVVLVPHFSSRNLWLVVPIFMLGLLSKETMVMFPLLVCACIFYMSPDRYTLRRYMPTWPLWILAVAFVIWRSTAPGFDGPQTYDRYYGLHEFSNLKLYATDPIYRVYTFLATLPVYAQLLMFPKGLHMERAFSIYTDPWHLPVLLGCGLVLLATVFLVYTYRVSRAAPGDGAVAGEETAPRPALSWGLLWFAAAHAPDTGLLIPMNALFLEHWMYVPSMGLFLGVSETCARLITGRKVAFTYGAVVVALIFAGGLACKTYLQNEVWKDPASFYLTIFSYGERSARAHNNLALYYTEKGQYVSAVQQFNEAVAISDSYAETRYNMAITYLQMPDRDSHIKDAVDCLQRALIIDPNFFRAYRMLGDIYGTMLHDKQTADYYYRRAKDLTATLR